VGIDIHGQANLFKPFTQARSSDGPPRGGTGLGLCLARTLARALGGDARLVASKPGVGSTFEFWIDPHLEVAEADASRKPKTTQPATARDSSVQGVSVLLVEDMPDNQLLFRKLLEDAGAKVLVSSSGEQALKLVDEGCNPDLVLMDLQMPGLDG